MRLVYWFKDHAWRGRDAWNNKHHIAKEDSDFPETTLCGINLLTKPGAMSFPANEEDMAGLTICALCMKSHEKALDST